MNPLSKKIRIISLAVTLVLFLIISPLVLGYSLGYRIDDLSDTFSWIKTGGVYIHSDLNNVEVYRDGKLVKTGGYIIKNVFIQNLRTDKDYVFEVRKNGYHSWRKVLPVKESHVTEARTMMLPLEIEKKEYLPFIDKIGNSTTTESEFTRKNENYLDYEILFEMASSTESFSEEILGSLSTAMSGSSDEQGVRVIGDEENIATTTPIVVPEYFTKLGVEDPDELDNLIENVNEIAWLEDGVVLIHWIGKEDRTPYYYCIADECRNNLKIDWDTEIWRFSFMPGRDDVVFILNESGIWATEVDDRSTRNIQPIYLGENLDFRISKNKRLIVLDNDIFYELRF